MLLLCVVMGALDHLQIRTEDLLLGLAVPMTFFAMLAIESIVPARRFPEVRFWRTTAVGFMVVAGTLSTIVPRLIPAPVLAWRLMDLSGLGVAGGAVLGWFAGSFVNYAYHRAEHRFHFLWRLHQIHHSARRVDIPGSAIFHPLDVVIGTTMHTVLLVMVVGLDPVAVAVVGYLVAFHGMFQHWNVRTPRWLGYVIERPESHGLHHELGVHARNYSDFPVWDMLFGSFQNPERFEGEAGFPPEASRRIPAMLALVDVSGAPDA